MSYLEERNRFWTIYPEYLDYRMSRRLGRKVPLSIAVDNPTLEELIAACKSLKLGFIVEKDRHHPANWIEHKGRLKVPKLKKISKRKLLKVLAHRIELIRQKKIEVEMSKEKKKSHIQKMMEKRLKKTR